VSWLLSGNHSGWPLGQPFGDGSERWNRARNPEKEPWDDDCYVTPLIGGHNTMDEIRQAFGDVIDEAESNNDADCHVYIAGWRFNPNRDMSTDTDPWHFDPVAEDRKNQTAWGLVRRMIFAGVKVRILLWLPPTKPDPIDFLFAPHIQAHFYLARLVRAANIEAKTQRGLQTHDDDLGVVFLDTRVSEAHPIIASHHQKFIVVRGINTNIAFCGGVDLAYTRRDAPLFHGDWQSGTQIPHQTLGITDGIPPVAPPDENQGSDLPANVDNKDMYGSERQLWHDLHLKLEGPVIKTMEHIFAERWNDPARLCLELGDDGYEMPYGSIISSSTGAIEPVFLSREYSSMSDDSGNIGDAFFVDYGVKSEEIIKVLVDGQTITESWKTDTWGCIHFHTTLKTWRDKSLEIQFSHKRPKPLPDPMDVPPPNPVPDKKAKVQVWLTIPFRGRARGAFDGKKWAYFTESGEIESALGLLRPTILISDPLIPESPIQAPPYRMGEFSNIAGVGNACSQARELIWIFDQYFWSMPYARLLSKRLQEELGLHLIIVLPPWSDQASSLQAETQHDLRWNALKILGNPAISNRVAVYVPWQHGPDGGFGVYCHAKMQMFDDQLLICGSCNINERSFTVDSEITCAVESQEVVQNYYLQLWNYFFNQSGSNNQFPTPNFTPGWGKNFFDCLFSESQWSVYGLVSLNYERAHLESSITLPNQVQRSATDTVHAVTEPINNPRGLAGELFLYRDLSGIAHDIHNYSSALRVFRRQHNLNLDGR